MKSLTLIALSTLFLAACGAQGNGTRQEAGHALPDDKGMPAVFTC
jgi:hypothetical protein